LVFKLSKQSLGALAALRSLFVRDSLPETTCHLT